MSFDHYHRPACARLALDHVCDCGFEDHMDDGEQSDVGFDVALEDWLRLTGHPDAEPNLDWDDRADALAVKHAL